MANNQKKTESGSGAGQAEAAATAAAATAAATTATAAAVAAGMSGAEMPPAAEAAAIKTAAAAPIGTAAPCAHPGEEARVEVFIPRGYAGEEPDLFIGVNGVNYLLPRGEASRVTGPVAGELRLSRLAQSRLDKCIDGLLGGSV